MLISQKIKRNNNQTTSVKIPLNSQNSISGDEQVIQRFVESETQLSVNSVNDGEKFIFSRRGSFKTIFEFFRSSSGQYETSLAGFGGFNLEEDIQGQSPALQNSFYIAQYYDTPDIDNQTLLHSSFLNGFEIVKNGESTDYSATFIDGTELGDIYLTQEFLDSQGDLFDIYVRYYFFNSKSGQVNVFLAKDNETLRTSQRLFYTVSVRKAERNFTYLSDSSVELKEVNNIQYKNKIGNSVDKLPKEKPNPPIGNGFSNLGEYVEL